MKPKAALVVSIVLNVVLAGAAFHFATHSTKQEQTPVPSSAPATAVEKPEASGPATVLLTVTNQSGQSFGWQLVESEDYRKYIANLRSIGCPEETIRDIIIADVNKLYDQRRKEITASTNKFEFWKAGNPMAMLGRSFDPERLEKLQALNKEKRELLKELLGIAPEEKADFMAGMNPFESMLDFLSPSKQSQVSEILTKFQAKQMKLFDGGTPTGDDLKKMRTAQKEMEGEMAAVLSPQEMEDYQLRMSTTAMTMRGQLGSFEPDEKEFREIFKLRKEFDDENGGMFGMAGMSRDEREKMTAAQKDLNGEIKSLLGDTRYAEYERSQDYSYQQLYRLTERNNIPKDTAVKAYDMQKLAQEKAREIRGDKTLTADQQKAALTAIRNETENAMKTTLGDKTWSSYREQPGAFWLRSISPDAAERPTTDVLRVNP